MQILSTNNNCEFQKIKGKYMAVRDIKHTTETRSRIIFERTMALYQSSTATNVSQAIFRQLTERDYGVDGQVELFSQNAPTGRIAYIQLKGTSKSIEKLKRSDEVSCSGISKSNIAYCQQRNVPVMLVYVSVYDEDFYFIDLQSVYKTALKTIGDNASGTVRIPIINHSSRIDKFFEIINHYYDDKPSEIINDTEYKERLVIKNEVEEIDEEGKNHGYIVGQYDNPSNGEHKIVNVTGELLAQGIWENDRLEKGIEFDYLIEVTSGKLIFKPDCPDDPYDASDDFSYGKMEQYGFDALSPLSFSKVYIEHEGVDKYYVVDMKVDGDTEQMVNIRTLEQFLLSKNPKLLAEIKSMIEEEDE